MAAAAVVAAADKKTYSFKSRRMRFGRTGIFMEPSNVISQLKACVAELQQRFEVRSLVVFGSVARGDARPDSDVDILVGFKANADFDRFMNLKFYLEDLLGAKVDLVTEKAMRSPIYRAIQGEMIRVA